MYAYSTKTKDAELFCFYVFISSIKDCDSSSFSFLNHQHNMHLISTKNCLKQSSNKKVFTNLNLKYFFTSANDKVHVVKYRQGVFKSNYHNEAISNVFTVNNLSDSSFEKKQKHPATTICT